MRSITNDWWLPTVNCRLISRGPIAPQFLSVGAAHTRIKRTEGRAREKVANMRRGAGKAHDKAAGGPTKPRCPGFTRSRSPLAPSSLKQCSSRKNKEINTERQRPAVWIRNLSPTPFVLRFYRTLLPYCHPYRVVSPARLLDPLGAYIFLSADTPETFPWARTLWCPFNLLSTLTISRLILARGFNTRHSQ